MIEMSLHQHLQQDDKGEEDTSMRSLIMHRFLRAATVVAVEHKNATSSSKRKCSSKSLPPLLHQQSQRTPSAHPTKSRSQLAPTGFGNMRPPQSQHQEDIMPHSMRGFFCLGLKSVLFCTHRMVDSASGHSMLRKKRWTQHLLHYMKASKEGNSLRSSEMKGSVTRKTKAMDFMTKYQSAISTDVPVLHPLSPDSANVKESCCRRLVRYLASFSRRGYPGLDGCTNAGCNPALSQSDKANLSGDQFENMKSKQTPLDEHVWVRKCASAALKEQEVKTVNEGENNMSSNAFQDNTSVLETNGGKSIHEDDDHNYEDDESHFCDALSMLNLVKSDTTSYTFGSSKSECEVLRFEGERINDVMDFTIVSSHFVTSQASMSENKSVLLHVCTANEKGLSGKMSSFSQRVGKDLKLETESKQAKSSTHIPCAYEQNHELQQAELQTKSFSRLRHHSLDSTSGLYPSKASAIFPMFPAKCQSDVPNSLGWPFGLSSYQSSRVAKSPFDIQQEKFKSIDKHAVGGDESSLPLPPAPTESWLGNAITKNAPKTSLLASLLQKETVASNRRKLECESVNLDAERKLDFQWMNLDAEKSWEDVVKGSQVHSGLLRYSRGFKTL